MLRIRRLSTSLSARAPHARLITTTPVTSPPPHPAIVTSSSPPLLVNNTPSTKPRAPPKVKAKGDISSVFPSLSKHVAKPLDPRFANLKSNLLKRCDPEQLQASWDRLLVSLEKELKEIEAKKSDIIPIVEFKDLGDAKKDEKLLAEIRKRGTVVIKGVIDEGEALEMKSNVRKYIEANKDRVKAFPKNNPSVYELYFSASQIRARTHPHLQEAHRFLLSSLWKAPSATSGVDVNKPVSYADRVRIRPPGDAGFALGPHIDGGSLERWEDPAYASIYGKIWEGKWEEYDPFAHLEAREDANMDMYNGAGACSMLRMWQGWLSMSHTGPTQGTLLVFPLLKHATAYTLLRPFFSPAPNNPTHYILDSHPTNDFPGSVPSYAQELSTTNHPHLKLDTAMSPVPHIKPGDYVAWHCDGIHAVEAKHQGKGDSSVMYIPAVPTTPKNLEYLVRQREAMEKGGVPSDFPGGGIEGEGEGGEGWVGRGGWRDVHEGSGEDGKKILGWGL